MSDSLQRSIDQGDLPNAWELARSRFETCFNSGRFVEALEYAEMGADLAKRAFTAPHASLAVSFTDCGLVHHVLDHRRQAAPLLRRGLKMQQQVLPPSDPEVGNTMMTLAGALIYDRKYEEAERLLDQALQIFTRNKRASLIGDAHYNLAKLYLSKKLKAKARTHFERAIAIYSRARNVTAHRKAAIRLELADLLLAMRRPKDAEPLLRAAYRIHGTAADYNNELWIAQMLAIITKRIALEHKRGLDTSRLEQRKEELEDARDNQLESCWAD
jgi:tetratricopeptide (TPR) repeat protein